ncbi:hypothetical protein CYMTET_20446 [Cymbomonas tetramitiformis]|uniref:Mic1 domain-containing protein n=1 Tax=Cymbomonas tetramitiformis TaxID=36881 RepID=A0AAE0L494_9CHLO|nr:hypothetical protein CYMTET_20446 [Cymbomonas tetramitiformis]
MYDDGNLLLLVASKNKLFSWPVDKVLSLNSPDEAESPTVSFLNEGPVISARFSLDGRILAVQRTATDVEFVNREDASEFWQRCRKGERLLGLFWVNTPECDCVFVTTGGLELYQLLPARNGVRAVDVKKHTVAWYTYTHETRLALLSSGATAPVRLAGYQFATSGVIRLPRFDLPSQASERNKRAVSITGKDVKLLTMYGRMYCAHVDLHAGLLVLYRFYRDALVRQHTYPLYSRHVDLSIVDQALVVHNIDSGVVLVLDVLSSSTHPLASPLPLALPPVIDHNDNTLEVEPYNSGWDFIGPDLLLDTQHGIFWRQQLDLGSLTHSCSDRCTLMSFLQRRREDGALPAGFSRPRQLSLNVVKTMIQDCDPLPVISRTFMVLCTAYEESRNQARSVQGSSEPNNFGESGLLPRSPAVSPEEMQRSVFEPLEEEMSSGGAYLLACVAEYIRCVDVTNLSCPASLSLLLVQLLQREDRLHQLNSWLPVLSRKSVSNTIAIEVAEISKLYKPSIQTVQDLLQNQQGQETYVRLLLREGRIVEALRYVRRHRVESVPPTIFLDAAKELGDPAIYTTVFRFCSEFVPNFANMADYPAYTRKLHGIIHRGPAPATQSRAHTSAARAAGL